MRLDCCPGRPALGYALTRGRQPRRSLRPRNARPRTAECASHKYPKRSRSYLVRRATILLPPPLASVNVQHSRKARANVQGAGRHPDVIGPTRASSWAVSPEGQNGAKLGRLPQSLVGHSALDGATALSATTKPKQTRRELGRPWGQRLVSFRKRSPGSNPTISATHII